MYNFKRSSAQIITQSPENKFCSSRWLFWSWFLFVLQPVHCSLFICSAERCSSVLLWSSRNVLRTTTLQLTFHQHGGRRWLSLSFTFGWIYPLNFYQFFITYNFIKPKSESYFRFRGDKSSRSVVLLLFLFVMTNYSFLPRPRMSQTHEDVRLSLRWIIRLQSSGHFSQKFPRLLLQRFKNAYLKCLFMTGIWRCIWVHPGKPLTKVLY